LGGVGPTQGNVEYELLLARGMVVDSNEVKLGFLLLGLIKILLLLLIARSVKGSGTPTKITVDFAVGLYNDLCDSHTNTIILAT
jgi:hypothetical protein